MSLQKLANFLSSPLEDDFKHEFDIEYFAKKASDNYFSNKVPLNESIKKFASDNGFNTEQTKRICEASNHNVNQHLFNTQEDKNIYFDIADASQITSEDSIKTASVNEYSFTPKEISSWARKDDEELQKEAGILDSLKKGMGIGPKIEHDPSNGPIPGTHFNMFSEPFAHFEPSEELDQLYMSPESLALRKQYGSFTHPEISKLIMEKAKSIPNLAKQLPYDMQRSIKQDHVELSGLDPKLNLQAVKEKIASALQKVQDDIYLADFKVKEAKYKLYKEAKVVLKDAPYYKLAQAIAMATNRHEILEDLTYDLMNDKLITEEDMFAVVKTAGELEERHPIVVWTKKFASLLDSFDSSLAAEKELQTQLLTIEKELK